MKDPRSDKKADRFTRDFLRRIDGIIRDPEKTDEEKLSSLGVFLCAYDSKEKRAKGYGNILKFFIRPLMRFVHPEDYVFNLGRKRIRLQMNRTIPNGDKGQKISQSVIEYMAKALDNPERAAKLIKHKRQRVPAKFEDVYTFSKDFWALAEQIGVTDDILWILNPDPSVYTEPVPKKDIAKTK